MAKKNNSLKRKKPTVPYSYEFGEWLREKREKAELSQVELGEMIEQSNQSISNWERGAAAPSFEAYVLLSDALNISENEMLKVLKEHQEKLFKEELKSIRRRLCTKK